MKIDIKQLNKMGNVEQIHAHMKYDIQSICFAEHWGRNDYSLNYIEKNYCWETILHEYFHISAESRLYYRKTNIHWKLEIVNYSGGI